MTSNRAGKYLSKLIGDEKTRFQILVEVESSILSEWLNGTGTHHLYNKSAIKKLKKAIPEMFDADALRELVRLAMEDRNNNELGFAPSSDPQNYELDDIEILFQCVHKLKLNGSPNDVLKFIPPRIHRLQQLKQHYPMDKPRIQKLIALGAVDLLDALTETQSKYNIKDDTRHLKIILRDSLSVLRDEHPEEYDMGLVLPSVVDYVADNLLDSIRGFDRLLDSVQGSRARATCVRDIAVAHAMLGHQGKIGQRDAKSQFRLAQDKALRVAESNSISGQEKILIYEGLSYGCGLLGMSQAEEFLHLAKKLQATEKTLAFDKAGIARTELSNLLNTPATDPQQILETASQTLPLLGEHGYERRRRILVEQMRSHPASEIREFVYNAK